MEPNDCSLQSDTQESNKREELAVESKKDAVPPLPHKSTWKGWAEIENDPVLSTAFFSCRHDTDNI